MSSVVYACSTNQGKLREFATTARQYHDFPYLIQPLPELTKIPAPEETGQTFESNARLKAVYYSTFTSELVLADDSGLEVNALGGAPGVHSARFAGPHASAAENNDLLLNRLSSCQERSARFVCVIALARSKHIVATFSGSVNGQILRKLQGHNGFGYDPLFFYPPSGKSFAEISTQEKTALSHRGQAARKLFDFLSTHPHLAAMH